MLQVIVSLAGKQSLSKEEMKTSILLSIKDVKYGALDIMPVIMMGGVL